VGDENDRFKPGDLIRAVGHVYESVRILGEGGMGVVYEVIERSVGARLALKVLHLEHARSRGSIDRRFGREARIPARLLLSGQPHTSFVRVHYLGTLEGEYRPYYAMDHLHGGTLKAHLKAASSVARRERRSPGLPADQALNLGLAMCFGAAALHERGVIHRDLKPDNIILHREPDGRLVLKIIDYGIAHLETEGEYAAPAGTCTYAAPEQFIEGRALSTKVDVFAIGAMLFEMLAGARPFDDYGTDWAAAVARADADPPSLAGFRPDLAPAIVSLVGRTLSPRADARPDVTTLYTTLQDIVNALPPIDPDDAVTVENPQPKLPAAAVKKLELAELGDPTAPEGVPYEVLRMRMEADRARVLGNGQNDTEPGMVLPFAATEPGTPPVADVELARAPAVSARTTPTDASAAGVVVTTPPTHQPPPPSTPDDIRYVDSLPQSRRPHAAESNTMAGPSGFADLEKLREALERGAAGAKRAAPRVTPAAGRGLTVPMRRGEEPLVRAAAAPRAAEVEPVAPLVAPRSRSAPRTSRFARPDRALVFAVTLVIVVTTGLAATVWLTRADKRSPSVGAASP